MARTPRALGFALLGVLLLGGCDGGAESPSATPGGATDAAGLPDYVPFVQEWEIEVHREPRLRLTGTLEWHTCGEWVYEARNSDGDLRESSDGTGPGGPCSLPGPWLLPIEAYRDNPRQSFEEVGPFEFEAVETRSCSGVQGEDTAASPVASDFCSDPDGTYEIRTVVAFDPATLIPIRSASYLDGSLRVERRSTSLKLLEDDE